jgi:terminase small subunit / prophage DNA-packing protein
MRLVQKVPDEGESPVTCIGRADLMDVLDLSTSTFSQYERDGLIARVGRDSYDLRESVRRVVGKLRAAASGRGDEDAALNLTAERARLAKEQADAQEMKNAQARGELVPAVEVERAWGDVLRDVRSRIMAVPSRVRQTGMVTADGADAVDREIRAALQSLGEDEPD